METCIIRGATVLLGIETWHVVQTHQPNVELLIATFTDGLQSEYLIPACENGSEPHPNVFPMDFQGETCLILDNSCKPAKLTYQIID